jgi:hypothetical protein
LGVLVSGYFAADISFIENIERILLGRPLVFLVGTVRVTPVPDTGKHQKNEAKPKNQAPTEVPVDPIIVNHLLFPESGIAIAFSPFRQHRASSREVTETTE